VVRGKEMTNGRDAVKDGTLRISNMITDLIVARRIHLPVEDEGNARNLIGILDP
jgi:hypothetical protein